MCLQGLGRSPPLRCPLCRVSLPGALPFSFGTPPPPPSSPSPRWYYGGRRGRLWRFHPAVEVKLEAALASGHEEARLEMGLRTVEVDLKKMVQRGDGGAERKVVRIVAGQDPGECVGVAGVRFVGAGGDKEGRG